MLNGIITSCNVKCIKASLGTMLIFAMAQIQIPFYPVPITFQSVAAILLGFRYRPDETLYSWAIYFVLGFIGLPVFFNFTAGLEKFHGPTAGYLFGMMLCSYAISSVKEKMSFEKNSNLKLFSLIIFGQLCVFIPGVIWLSTIIGFKDAILSGFIFFIPSGIVKTVILAIIFRLVYGKNL